MTWQKAKAAQVQQGLYAIEPPVPKVNESEPESKPCLGGTECTVDECGCYHA